MTAMAELAVQPERTDFYALLELFDKDDRVLLETVREFMTAEVAPIINSMWTREQFPHHLIPRFGELGIGGLPYQGYGCPGRGYLLDGAVMMEMASIDSSMATFQGVHSGLAMGSIYVCGSEEQKNRWLPAMARYEQIGAFALTEPEVGSGAARGLTTTARREGDTWILDGEKKWIGNATFADLNVVWAVDQADQQVKGFVVEGGTPGFEAVKMSDKIALRVVQNAHITLTGCRVPEANRLQGANSFADTAQVLRRTRLGVAWEAVGCAKGAYDVALAYAKQREQFGRPIGGFQLVQDMLVRMLGNITASQCMVFRLGMLADQGSLTEEQASLAKAYTTVAMRESVGLARELMGGNGILLDHNVGRFVADAEAIYSYEGTREINTLVVGRAITGLSAFT
jgi:glutaryl-CoA dehydrogenase